MKIAMFSYNAFVVGHPNGWVENEHNSVLLIQNDDGSTWGVDQDASTDTKLEHGKQACVSKVESLWSQLVKELPTIEKVVFYVGSYGAERAIELAAAHGLTPDRAVFVFCPCGLGLKMEMLRKYGFSSSKIIRCECGGTITMMCIYRDVLVGVGFPG